MTEDRRAPSTLRTLARSLAVESADTMERLGRDGASATEQPAVANLNRTDSQRSAGGGKMRSPPPIRDVINDALQDSPAKSSIDPELLDILITTVTDRVTKNLVQQQAAGTNPLATPPLHASPALSFRATMSPTDSFFNQNTPPTPDQRSESRWSNDFSYPDLAMSDAGSQFSQHSRNDTTSPPLPNLSKSTTYVQPSSDAAGSSFSGDTELISKSTTQRPSRVDSKVTGAVKDDYPSGAPQQARVDDETALERAWQPLFHDGVPTARLGSFLRGLALHLIEENDPKGSLVVTPSKMLRFFNETKVTDEHYPWHTIYSRLTHASLSSMYRNLGCQHHLVQRTNQEQPTVPGLTPAGFEDFMTCLIQAHPEAEFERLSKAVVDMPISSADDRSHRFPKELSRRLLPSEANTHAQQRLVSSMSHEQSVMAELKGSVAMPPPPPSSAPPSQRPPAASFGDRPRQPYTQDPLTSDYAQDDDFAAPSIPIERERKPYTAKEGTGKLYNTEDTRPPMKQYNGDTAGARPSRANSGLTPQGMYPPTSQPVNIPQRSPHRGSTSQAQPPPGSYTRAAHGRSSPPPRNAYVNSDPFNVGSVPDQQFGSHFHPSQSNPMPVNHGEDAYSRSFRARSRADRSYSTTGIPGLGSNSSGGISIPNRNAPPGNANGFPFGSMGGPVGDLPPSMSYSSRRPPLLNTVPDRRRSLFASSSTSQHGGGDSGSDASGPYIDSMNGNYPPAAPSMQQYGTSSQY